MPAIQVTQPLGSAPTYKYEPRSGTFVTSQPRVRDPLDQRNVYVANSLLPVSGIGDGLFARRFLPAGSLVAYYAGTEVSTRLVL